MKRFIPLFCYASGLVWLAFGIYAFVSGPPDATLMQLTKETGTCPTLGYKQFMFIGGPLIGLIGVVMARNEAGIGAVVMLVAAGLIGWAYGIVPVAIATALSFGAAALFVMWDRPGSNAAMA